MHNPLVSVIIPLHNAEQYICECVESVLAQTYPFIEIIIVENCSSDKSFAVASHYESVNTKILQSTVPNASAARNIGIKAAKGQYIQFLDADDYLPPSKIEKQISQLEKQHFDSSLLSFCSWKKTKYPGEGIHLSICHSFDCAADALIELSLVSSSILQHCYLTPYSLIQKSGLWDESLSLSDDGDFFARVLSNARGLLYCGDTEVEYRDTPNSLSKSISKKAIDSQIRSAISIAKCMQMSNHPSREQAQVSNLVRSVNYLYPYYRAERKFVESYLEQNYGNPNMNYPKRNIREWIFYWGVCCGFFSSEYSI